jgi:hypothetical protein
MGVAFSPQKRTWNIEGHENDSLKNLKSKISVRLPLRLQYIILLDIWINK